MSITTESTSATPEYLLSCLLSGAYYLPQESLLRTQSTAGRNFVDTVISLFCFIVEIEFYQAIYKSSSAEDFSNKKSHIDNYNLR